MTDKSTTTSKRFRVAVFGHVGQGNLGDEAAFQTVIDAVKSHRPDAEIIGNSVNPMDTSVRYGIQAYSIWREIPVSTGSVHSPTKRMVDDVKSDIPPTSGQQLKTVLRRVPGVFKFARALVRTVSRIPLLAHELLFLRRLRRLLKPVDLLIVAGSQHFNDYVLGPWNFPYTTCKWTILAKLAGTKVVFLNVGAGPLRTVLGKWLIKQAVIWSDYQSYRDTSSVECIKELGVPIGRAALPDLVFALSLSQSKSHSNAGDQRKIVGINPIPFNSADYWVGASQEGYQRYIRMLASFAQWLLDRGYRILFFPTQLTLDPLVIQDIRAHLHEDQYEPGAVAEASIKTVDDLCTAIDPLSFVVASRFHGLIFSMLHEKPTLGISYAEKGRDLMAYMGQSDYVVDILTFDLQSMQDRFQKLESDEQHIKSVLREMKNQHRTVVETQFDDVFALLG